MLLACTALEAHVGTPAGAQGRAAASEAGPAAPPAPAQVAALPSPSRPAAAARVDPGSALPAAPTANNAVDGLPAASRPAPVRVAAALNLPGAPREVQVFLEQVFKRLPPAGRPLSDYKFEHWSVAGKPTEEAVGLLPVPGVDPERLIARVMDVDHYVPNVDHVYISKSVNDPAFQPPKQVRFYEVVDISPIGKVQQELVLVDAGTVNGYRLAYWYLLKDKTDAHKRDDGARSQYNVGAWLVAPNVVGYALSSAPKRDDVNFVQWAALTTGADIAASSVIKNNIQGMAAWSKKK
jgi:hypothetical protein